jgi:hypothetical protein
MTLSSRPRRVLLDELANDGGTTQVEQLPDRLDVGSMAEISEQECLVALYHVHIPNMEEAGLITHDDDRLTLTDSGRRARTMVVEAREELSVQPRRSED